MKNLIYIPLSIACLIIGILFFAYQQELIVFRFARQSVKAITKTAITKKNASLYYLKDGKWQQEKQNLIWPEDKAVALNYLITSWLNFMAQEHLTEKKVTLQTVVLSTQADEAYLSFDASPFSVEQSIHEKWVWLEALLKTIRESTLGIQRIRFLVNHKPLNDYQLDFTNSWPINGFMS